MTQRLGFAGMALAVALGQGIVAAPWAATAAEQDVIAGRVTEIDHERSRVTVQSSDGKSHEFEASAETLKDLAVGDRIEAKRRPPPD